MPRPTPTELLRAELDHKRRTLPMFLRPQLGEVIHKLDHWITDTDARLVAIEAQIRALNKMPSPAALEVLVSP